MGKTNSALIILKGDKPSLALIDRFWRLADKKICADGAADICLKLGKIPDVIIGDLDSLQVSIENKLALIEVIHLADQNTTDGEKAVEYCINNGYFQISILGATGKRLDHELYNLGLLKKYQRPGIDITLYSEDDQAFIIRGKTDFRGKPGTRISLMPIFGDVFGVTSTGLRYSINNKTFGLGEFCSISNEFSQEKAVVDFEKGQLLVVIDRSVNKNL